jgi:predicted O-methyltransferase YrrM
MSQSRSLDGPSIKWLDKNLLQCGSVQLKLMPGLTVTPSTNEVITLFKDPNFVKAYLDLLRGRQFHNMVEVGVMHGGSAIFFWHMLQLEKLCCIELNESAPVLSNYIETHGLKDDFLTYFGVNQGDRSRLQAIIGECFPIGSIDLVIDDASHIYTPSLATFETLFPLLQPGGLYILEDWRASLLAVQRPNESDAEPPLHQLVHEILDFATVNPHIMPSINCNRNFVVIERGEGFLPAEGFSLANIAGYFLADAKSQE